MYSLHDLEITGISVKEVLDCEINSVIGEHGTLMILARVDSEEMLDELPDLRGDRTEDRRTACPV